MCHPIYHIVSFEIVEPYTLKIHFDDDTAQVINFKPILRGEIYSPLRDLAFFNQVRIDPVSQTLIWPNDADFDPADLHDWPEIEASVIEHVAQWEIH
jgi:hypothetical protein